MSIALILLYLIVFILVITFIYLSIAAITSWNNARSIIIVQNTKVCTLPLDQLVPLDPTTNICCYSGGAPTGAYYVAPTQDNVTIPMSVTPVATYYINVCREYCITGYTVRSDGTLQCQGEVNSSGPQTTLANTCVELIRPRFPDGTDCRGSALPVAALGTKPMYALHLNTSIGFAQCEILGACP
jgi:hypothetical protein